MVVSFETAAKLDEFIVNLEPKLGDIYYRQDDPTATFSQIVVGSEEWKLLNHIPVYFAPGLAFMLEVMGPDFSASHRGDGFWAVYEGKKVFSNDYGLSFCTIDTILSYGDNPAELLAGIYLKNKLNH